LAKNNHSIGCRTSQGPEVLFGAARLDNHGVNRQNRRNKPTLITANAIDFLDNHAPSFFLAVRDSFLADLVISVTRFPDSTKGTPTLSSVVKHLEKSSHCDLVDTLWLLQGEIVTLSKPIKKWRHNLVAHRTLKFAGASPQEPLPDVSWDQIDAVLEKLVEALNAIQAYFTNAETGMRLYGSCVLALKLRPHSSKQI
jgi:hypothetical protein